MKFGVCYYPEHWPSTHWDMDAQYMRELGIEFVRVGEFSWGRLEPRPGELNWSWLDHFLEISHKYKLKIVLGTPTSTPPKWLVDKHPEMLAKDKEGKIRGFGSRRHYTFASESYRKEIKRIVTLMAKRYGNHPAVYAWQTDNEYGCHDTILSYAEADLKMFRLWLADKYGCIAALNAAWGNVFWSMEYLDFNAIELPNLTVTEANPVHRLDFHRCASDQVVAYNRLQVDILRKYSPGRHLIHNYMGFFTGFDHFQVSKDLDIASWDNYPLGFLDTMPYFSDDERLQYMRTGHPDSSAFHHDLYRACGKGRLWIMEQQSGPVNWATNNPIPAPGAVRMWTWEAFSHGAEVVSYFRWRQTPFAQEQMHAGLLRPDGNRTEACYEVEQVSKDIVKLCDALSLSIDDLMALPDSGQVAIIFDYDSCWMTDIQPLSEGYCYLSWFYRCYSVLRKLGVNIDVVSQIADLSDYHLVILPSQTYVSRVLIERLKAFNGVVFFGPRSGSKTQYCTIPDVLPPGYVKELVDVVVERIDALPKHSKPSVYGKWGSGTICDWCEQISTQQAVLLQDNSGMPVLIRQEKAFYLGACIDNDLLTHVFEKLVQISGLSTTFLPEGLRIRDRGILRFVFNYSADERCVSFNGYECLQGSEQLAQCDVSIWRRVK